MIRTLAPKVLIGVALIGALAGCGLRGDLQRPPPMWGDARAQYEREHPNAANTPAPAETRARSTDAEDQPGIGSGDSSTIPRR